jgi:hypothetical protein
MSASIEFAGTSIGRVRLSIVAMLFAVTTAHTNCKNGHRSVAARIIHVQI